jgi:ubiquitin thioesterase OTU1
MHHHHVNLHKLLNHHFKHHHTRAPHPINKASSSQNANRTINGVPSDSCHSDIDHGAKPMIPSQIEQKQQQQHSQQKEEDGKIGKDPLSYLLYPQTPNPEGLIMIRREMPADNSCLFHAIAYALENDKDKATYLRHVVAEYIFFNQDKYKPPLIEMPASQYSEWILKNTSWGGSIELEILSNHYAVQICVVDVGNLNMQIFGQDKDYAARIYLLFYGDHYDLLVRNITDEEELMKDSCIFHEKDRYAYEGAIWVATNLNSQNEFKDNGSPMDCKLCGKNLKGRQEVMEHVYQTGHRDIV